MYADIVQLPGRDLIDFDPVVTIDPVIEGICVGISVCDPITVSE